MDCTLEKSGRHPCFSLEASHKHARMHLPVAPNCNISCNYCSRKYDCLHESRPGVTSEVLSPEAALEKYKIARDKLRNISVVGIAGPGDALADWENTRRTVCLIKQSDPDVLFCLSTNGLMLPDYGREIIALGIRHVTVTVNCLSPETGGQIYRFVNYKGKKYTGREGAGILIENQLSGIEYLAASGAAVKVNTVMIKGINDNHIPEIVKKVKGLGAFVTNIMPLIPAPGSPFEGLPQTCMKEINRMRNICSADLRQMYHCRQCRADAVGLLDSDRSVEFRCAAGKEEADTIKGSGSEARYKIAVASKHGILIDQHFGHATEFTIYRGNGESFQQVEKRKVAQYCDGADDCEPGESKKESIVSAISDCDAVVTLRIGYHARERLLKRNILSVEHCDTIENGLKYAVEQLNQQSP